MQIVTIDFETYWAQDYSLKAKGMNMSEYVRDERFAAHMMALKIDDGVTRIVRPEDIPAALAEIDWSSSALLCHNTAFDGFILSQRYDVVPSYYYDTLSMARGRFSVNFALDLDSVAKYCGFEGKIKDVLKDTKGVLDLPPALWGKLAGYCANDNDETYRIFQFMLPEYPQDELDLIDITIRMFCEPVLRVDLPRVQAALEAEVGKKVGAIIKAGAIAADLMSNQRFEQLLLERGVIVPKKISPRTKKVAPAFAKNDRGFRALMKDPNARQLVEARLAIKSTIGETRAGRLLKVGDEALPVMLNYCGAHTTRWSAGNKMNLQNLPRGGELRKAILAPEGHVVVVADSAQIEARVLAWLAEHDELLVQFASGSDVYKWMAAKIYGKPMDEITKDERFIGKVLVLGLGYGMGATKLQETLEKGALGAAPVIIPGWQAAEWVETYRSANVPIVKLWEKMKQLIIRMAADIGTSTLFPPLEIVHESAFLPNGLALQYPDLKITVDKDTNERGYTYISRGKRTRIYGGLFTENCIAEGTQVLTDSGWKNIEEVGREDLVHDGVEFVQHSGLLAKTAQTCVTIDGVYMTPDHEVLTDEGWKPASQSPQPYRPNLWEVNSAVPGNSPSREDCLEVSVRLRNADFESRYGSNAKPCIELRVLDVGTDQQEPHDAWDDPSPGFFSVELDAPTLQGQKLPRVQELRCPGHSCMQRVEEVSEFLGGHGGHVQTGAVTGTCGQQRRVQSEQLHLGDNETASHESAGVDSNCRHPCSVNLYGNQSLDVVRTPEGWMDSRAASPSTKLSAAHKKVYDLLNAGPRQRFVVLGDSGPFIVHNCVQALARCVVAEQMREIAKRWRVVTMTHDEIVCVAPQARADECLQDMLTVMRTPPEWGPGIPLGAEGGWDTMYSK